MAPEQEVTVVFGQKGADIVTRALDSIVKGAEQLKKSLAEAAEQGIAKSFKDFGEAFKQGSEAAQGMGGMVQFLSGSLAAMTTPLGLVAVGLGAVVETGKLVVEVFEESAAEAEKVFMQMRQLSAVTGENVTETKALVDAFQLGGFQSDMLTRSLFRLSMEIEQGGERLAQYGISTRDMANNLRQPGAVFIDIINKTKELDNAAERSAFLRHLFGRQGVQLAGFVAAGASLDELIAKAKEMGIYDEEDQERTAELVKAKAALSLEMEHLWLEIAKTAVPIITAITNGMASLVDIIRQGTKATKDWKETLLLFLGIRTSLMGEKDKPAPGAPAAAAPTPAATGPIMTPASIQAEAKLAEERLKVNTKYFAEIAKLQSTSHADAMRVELAALDDRLAIEREKTRKLEQVTEDPVKKRKLREEMALKEVQIEGEKNLMIVKIQEAEAQDARKNLELQVNARKQLADEQVKIVQIQKDEELRLIDRVQTDEETKIRDRQTVEIGAARDTAAIKKASIDEEITKLKTLASMYSNNAALQRDIAQQIGKLNHDRTMAELDEVAQVDKARDDAAKAEMARRDKMAGMFSQLAKQAEEYAKAQGRTTVTIADITAAQAKLTQEAQSSLASFFGGGAVDPAKLQQALQFTSQQRQMQQIGATPESITGAAFGQVQQTYGAGLGYDAAIQAYQRGDIAGGKALQAQAAAQGDVELAGLKTPMDKDVVNRVVDSIGKKGNEVIDSMLLKIPEITTGWMEKFSDNLIRKLEFEAART